MNEKLCFFSTEIELNNNGNQKPEMISRKAAHLYNVHLREMVFRLLPYTNQRWFWLVIKLCWSQADRRALAQLICLLTRRHSRSKTFLFSHVKIKNSGSYSLTKSKYPVRPHTGRSRSRHHQGQVQVPQGRVRGPARGTTSSRRHTREGSNTLTALHAQRCEYISILLPRAHSLCEFLSRSDKYHFRTSQTT